ncbi:MAG: 5-bromo-4-chloroindolyl phosphate hydrolysis family protein [Pseudomonadota bacterium]
MALPEGTRQTLLGIAAALVFLVLFFGLSLVWWAAFLAGLLVYAGLLFLVPRKPDAVENNVAGRVTEADIKAAGRSMGKAVSRLEAAADRVGETERSTIAAIIGHVSSIRGQVLADPEDYRRARRFVTSYLDHMVETVDRYAELSEKSRGRHEDRLLPLTRQIESFVPALEKIDAACLENDFVALEAQVEALATQMKRG